MVKMQLLDQYVKYQRGIQLYEQIIQRDCVKGYISRKNINGRQYHYLQWTNSGKTHSKYIRPEHLDVLQKNIQMRKKYEQYVREMKQGMKEIQKFVGLQNVRAYLEYIAEDAK